MNSRLQPFLNNSLAIRQEIQRFESVHPSIYAIYDLIDLIPDGLVAQQIRDHVVCIEGKLFFFLLTNKTFPLCSFHPIKKSCLETGRHCTHTYTQTHTTGQHVSF